jgi:hypothetical protein
VPYQYDDTTAVLGNQYYYRLQFSAEGCGGGTSMAPQMAHTEPDTVTISGNAGVALVMLTYPGGSTSADDSGHYAIVVAEGWSGTVTPAKTGYSFSPINRTYDDISADMPDENYTATRITPSISGTAGVAGAVLNYDDGGPKTWTADGTGAYSFMVPYGWSGTVIPSKSGYTFTPDQTDYSDVTSNRTAQNYTAVPLPPTVPRIFPASGDQVCAAPQVGVDLLLTNWLRTNGSFDLSKISLLLDGTDVTSLASSLQTMTSPASFARVLYTPATNLASGTHQADLTYLTASGPRTLKWSFTVAGMACPPESGTHGPESGETPPYSSPDTSPADRRDIDNP